jgi:hypothetical protein
MHYPLRHKTPDGSGAANEIWPRTVMDLDIFSAVAASASGREEDAGGESRRPTVVCWGSLPTTADSELLTGFGDGRNIAVAQ